MTRLIIFDLDGTLLNTIDDLAASVNHALRLNGYPEHPLSAYPFFVGNGVNKLLERALPEEARNPETVRRLRADFTAHYSEHNADFTRPYPGIPELIEALRERGAELAVGSNKYHEATVTLNDRHLGAGTFRTVLGQREGVPVKPDPTIVRDILRETGHRPEETLYVGDSGVDMLTAAAAGVRSVGVTWGFRPRQELEANGAAHLIDRPEALLSLL